jgi:hypothetical protein
LLIRKLLRLEPKLLGAIAEKEFWVHHHWEGVLLSLNTVRDVERDLSHFVFDVGGAALVLPDQMLVYVTERLDFLKEELVFLRGQAFVRGGNSHLDKVSELGAAV